MKTITSRKEIQPYISDALAALEEEGADAFINSLHKTILKKKVKFPVLEYAAHELYEAIPERLHIPVTDKIIALHEIGSYVLAGIILQLRLERHFDKAIAKATEYIIKGDEWYVCDIIGERVMGYALLTEPKKILPILKKLARHKDKWIVRCVGVAAHYAVKKGLKRVYVQELFALLLSLSNTTDFHTKKGIGWAAKTTAKFHPDIVADYAQHIETSKDVKQWFKTKIKIGLGRTEKYAHRYNS